MEASNYDDDAVAIMVEIDELIRRIPSPPHQPARRCHMIRAAIEGQVEYLEPPPALPVLAHLTEALVAQGALIGAHMAQLRALLERLTRHLGSRRLPDALSR